VTVADRPDLEDDHADQQRAEGDERRQPAFRLGRDQRDNHDGVGAEQEARQNRAYRRPASQVRSALCFIAVSRRRVTRTCPRVRITSVL
jgi:hypothetical protein